MVSAQKYNIFDNIIHYIVENVHSVTRLPVAFGLLSGLAVASITDALGGIDSAVLFLATATASCKIKL